MVDRSTTAEPAQDWNAVSFGSRKVNPIRWFVVTPHDDAGVVLVEQARGLCFVAQVAKQAFLKPKVLPRVVATQVDCACRCEGHHPYGSTSWVATLGCRYRCWQAGNPVADKRGLG